MKGEIVAYTEISSVKQKKKKQSKKELSPFFEKYGFESEEELLQFFKEQDYKHVRKLPDGTYAGLYRLMFTTAICTGLDRYGYKNRFCYETLEGALAGLRDLEHVDYIPEGWVARR